MSPWHIVLRSLRHYWRTNLFIMLGVVVATAVITGSLLVGDSMTASLRDSVLSRLGRIDDVLMTPHFFPATLGRRLVESPNLRGKIHCATGLLTQGGVRRADSSLEVTRASVLGVDDDFWKLFASGSGPNSQTAPALRGTTVAVSQSLADDLHLTVGTEVLVSVDRSGTLADDVLFAHRKRDETLRLLRVKVAAIVLDGQGGDFSMQAGVGGATSPRNVFIARDTLATALEQPRLANFILLDATTAGATIAPADIQKSLAENCGLADYGFKLVTSDEGHFVALESDSLLISDGQVAAAQLAAKDAGGTASPMSVYLATRITKTQAAGGTPAGNREIAYSIVAAAPEGISWKLVAGTDKDLGDDGAVLNDWAATDLAAHPGDKLELTYLVPTRDGTYIDATVPLKVAGIVELSGPAADRHMTPGLNGLTDAKRIEEWKLPFPVDHKRLTDRDEDYWEKYGATPKIFVSADLMRRIWARTTAQSAGANAGWATAVRLVPPAGIPLDDFAKQMAAALPRHLSPEANQMAFRPVRQEMLASAAGSTDFGQLFLAMSFFLVVAAGAMAGTLMRLLVEQRAGEIGLLLSCGWRRRKVTSLLIQEGIALTAMAVILGVPAGILYSSAILAAMARWWMGPWGHPALRAHLAAPTLVYGAASGLVLGLVCVVWGMRAANKVPLLRLLSGRQSLAMAGAAPRNGRWAIALSLLTALVAAAMIVAAAMHAIAAELAFFGGGTALLLAILIGISAWFGAMLRRKRDVISLWTLAMRNAAANRRRSMLAIGLLACATFILVSVAANRRDYSQLDTSDPRSGSGGFALRATTTVPLHFDLGSIVGRKSLGFSPDEEKAFSLVKCVSLAESPGDDVSCLNLAQPTRPRLLGVTREMPPLAPAWQKLFDGPDADGAIAAIGDADSVQWILHCDVGGIYTFAGPEGKPVKLRIVGLIPGSIFAGELLIGQENLLRIYPKLNGTNYFLFSVPGDGQRQTALMDALRSALADQGVEVHTTREILNRYISVQNIYVSIFLSLGGLGLLLGTAGLIAVIARSVLERRGELALMAAAGFRRSALVRLITMEHGGLLAAGLLCGAAAALLAVAPVLASGRADVQWSALAGTLATVAAAGLLACIITSRSSIGPNPMMALREE